MSTIAALTGRQILDSQGYPTIEIEATLTSGVRARSSVPSGASPGRLEATAARDGGDRWSARGVTGAVGAVGGEVAGALRGRDSQDQSGIDRALVTLDGTSDKSRLGANTMLATSLAIARASARDLGLPLWRYLGGEGAVRLPVPLLDVINGGVHAANRLDFEEFMLIPAGASTFSEALRMATEVFHELRYVLLGSGHGAPLGAGGGFAPDLQSNAQALQMLMAAITAAGYEPGWDVWIGIDAAASQLRSDGGYELAHEGRRLSAKQLIAYYAELCRDYPLLVLEDGLADDDRDAWAQLTTQLGDRLEVAGDDLFATNPAQLQRGIDSAIANAIVIKPNQIGTLTETLQTIALARDAGYATIIAHRAGETEDTTICDLAVATRSPQLKAGAPSRERAAKYNRMLRIEEALGDDAVFPGITAFGRPEGGFE
ncbi:MAG TPA: phosphopyruvate hydratase [Solirubrobacteraceae bacterium]|nr:phosphopyruvate hydratase [Solirubrobacteraceae bacterium]